MGERTLIPGVIYRHVKDKPCQIVTVATHSETGEELVIYQELYGDYSVYARPVDMFLSGLEHEKHQEVKSEHVLDKVTKGSTVSPKNEDISQVNDNDRNLINQDLLDFLNADEYKEKIDILDRARKRLDTKTLDNMAVSLDYILPEGSDEDKINSLIQVLRTRGRYELRRRNEKGGKI